MSLQTRRLRPGTPLSALSSAVGAHPRCPHLRAPYTTCAHPVAYKRRTKANLRGGFHLPTTPRTVFPAIFVAGQRRSASAVAAAAVENGTREESLLKGNGETDITVANPEDIGPIQEYDRRVDSGILRNDEHQRGETSSQWKF